MPYNRKAQSSMDNSYQSAINNNDGGNFGPSVIKFPQGVKAFKFDPAKANTEQYINILPWAIETEKHPRVAKGEAKIGDNDFMLDVFTHYIDGVLKGSAICMAQTYGQECPFEKETEGQNMPAAKRRTLFWVQACDRNGKPTGDGAPMILNTSHYAFTKLLLEEADIQGRDRGYNGSIPFANPDKGFVVGFRYSMDSSGNGQKYAQAKRIDFYERTTPIPEKLLDSIQALDALIEIPTRKSIHDALYGKGSSAGASEAEAAEATEAADSQPAANEVRPDETF